MNWVDVLDIIFIGALLSIGSVWLKKRTARAILFALVPMLVTYALAGALKMYLTSQIFQFGIISVFVSIVVIFQDDFRRAFESLATWRPWGSSRSLHAGKLADILTDTLTSMAKESTGALIVLQGRQPLEQHVRSGIALNGTISQPLLLSIFDANSPGHDGAVTINEGRITTFGAHLPLSRNSTGRLGTRHAAALGLVEKCDCLVLVVSEETGTVSIAHEAKIAPAKNASEIRDAITKHFRRVGPASVHRTMWEIPWLRLSGSFMLASVLWVVFARPTNLILRTVDANIVFKGLPKNWEAKPPDPSKVKITLFGPEGPLMQLDPVVMAVQVDLFRASEGQQTFAFAEADINLPPRVRVKRFEPPEIVVHAYSTNDVEVPVTLKWQDTISRLPQSSRLEIRPSRVIMKLPSRSPPPISISTAPIDAQELMRTGRVKTRLLPPADIQGAEVPQSAVEVRLIP